MNYSVIIVDDEPWTREVIKQVVNWEALGLRLAGEASDGVAGFQLFQEINPDILITDMRMPGMDGVALMRTLIRQKANLKIIIISGYNDYGYLREAVKYKAMDYLLKPIDPDELNSLLLKCIQELNEKNIQDRKSYEPDSILEVDWYENYLTQKTFLNGCLMELNMQAAKDILAQIGEMVLRKEGPDIPAGMIMKIYYDLIWMIEQFVVKEGYSMALFMSNMPGKLVFHNNILFSDVMDYLSTLIETVILSLEEHVRNRNRINLDKIQGYVDSHYMENIHLEAVAAHFFVSKEYLSKMFKSYIGVNFSEYITSKRMEKAKEMIAGHGMQIKNVAELLGYVDIAHFYKTFKKYFGMTPGEIRK